MANKSINLKGGLDLSSNKNERQAGTAKEALNVYESSTGGYTNVRGYERFDGKTSPSLATYFIAKFENWDAKTVTDFSGEITLRSKRFRVLELQTDTALNTAMLVLTATNVNGLDFTDTSTELGGALLVDFGEGSAATDELDSLYREMAQDFYRSRIAKPEGSGAIRGVAQTDTSILAFRDSVAGDTLNAYRATESGWQSIPWAQIVSAPKAVRVSAGDELNDGNFTVLGVYPYLDDNGTRQIEKNVYSLKVNSGSLTVGATLTPDKDGSTIGAIEEVINFKPKPAGKVRSFLHNFYASDSTRNLYLVDGKNCAYSYHNGQNILVPFASNMRKLDDVFTHVIAHASRLWLATDYGTLLTSVAGEPEQLDGFLGGTEWGAGDRITGMAETNASSLYVFTQNTILVIKGTGGDSWQQNVVSSFTGATDGGHMALNDVLTYSKRGLTSLARTEVNGGFAASEVSEKVNPLVRSLKPEDLTAVTLLKRENQIRFYFGDRFLMLTRVMHNVNGKEGVRFGITEGRYNFKVTCADAAERSNGTPSVIAGGEDGYVYSLEKGRSADGLELEFSLVLNDNHLGDPWRHKRFRRAYLMSNSEYPVTLTFSQTNDSGAKAYGAREVKLQGGGSVFDSGRWDEAIFDGNAESRKALPLLGSGYNIELAFYLSSKSAPQFTLHSYTLDYTPRGLTR